MYYNSYNSPLGIIILACDNEQNLTGLWFEGQKYFGKTLSEKTTQNNSLKIFSETKKWLDKYFNNKKPIFSEIQLKPEGTEFQKYVWKLLCQIPYGKIATYGNIAKQIAKETGTKKMSAQAVGGAISHNPISIIIPCHRVIGSNGNLTGYAAGIARKAKLLKHEGINIRNFTKSDIT